MATLDTFLYVCAVSTAMDSESSTSAAAVEHGRSRKYASEEDARGHKNASRRAKKQTLAAAESNASRHPRSLYDAKITRHTYSPLTKATVPKDLPLGREHRIAWNKCNAFRFPYVNGHLRALFACFIVVFSALLNRMLPISLSASVSLSTFGLIDKVFHFYEGACILAVIVQALQHYPWIGNESSNPRGLK